MKWIKEGLVFGPAGRVSWAAHSALQPSPLRFSKEVIRIYAGMRDADDISRIGYVDVKADNPSEVIGISEAPCLDIGIAGCFDDNGVVPCCAVQTQEGIYLYYAGYQLVGKVRFLVFGGLAFSRDGSKFERVQVVPVVDRTPTETLFRVIHTAMQDGGRWRIWYGGGSQFQQGKYKTLPVYDIRYTESADGIHIPQEGRVVLPTSGDEYRIARPNVIKKADGYHMFLCHGSETDPYSLGYAYSKDGINWIRNDALLGLEKTSGSWDSEMMAYPAYIETEENAYLFYNGNNYGYEGFGYARLVSAD
ncbi:MAG TPA: hypothetical protein VFT64_07565 [Rickettsiales bacterium]|nr:hypothetical protein [Rickettsiales bacterium]